MIKKIFIGMPLYEGNISHVTLSGIIDLIQWFSLKKIEYKFCFISKVLSLICWHSGGVWGSNILYFQCFFNGFEGGGI